MSEPIEGAAPAASDPSSPTPAEMDSPVPSSPNPSSAPAASSPPVPVRPPFAWAKARGLDPALVAGAAVLARWPAGNLKDGSLLVSEADFDAAMRAFAGLEIRG